MASDMAVTLREVAEKSCVSLATASRVLNNDATMRISKPKRERILKTARELKYVPHGIARSLASKKTFRIGVITGQSDSGLVEHDFLTLGVLRGIETHLKQHGYLLSFIQISENDPEKEFEDLFAGRGNRHDGVFFLYDAYSPSVRKMAWENDVPLVVIDPFYTDVMPGMDFSCVCLNRSKAFYEAAEILVASGRKNIAFIGAGILRDKLIGFKQYFAESGLSFRDELIRIDREDRNPLLHRKEAETMALQLISEIPDIDGIVTSSDWVAFGVLDAMQTLGKKFPGDIAVVGYDNIEGIGGIPFGEPVLTTMDNPRRKLGVKAAEMMLQALRESPEKRYETHSVWLQPELIVRKTLPYQKK